MKWFFTVQFRTVALIVQAAWVAWRTGIAAPAARRVQLALVPA